MKFMHDMAQEKRCRVVELIDMQGRPLAPGVTETEANYLCAHNRIVNRKN